MASKPDTASASASPAKSPEKPTPLPLLVVLLPLFACAASAVPTAVLRVLVALEASWPLGAVSAPLALRFAGATALVAGHATSVRNKPRLSRADWGYLVGVSLLSVTFGSLCFAVALEQPALALPPFLVSLAGASMLVCFAILARNALAQGVTALTRAAVVAAIAGSGSLIVAGVSPEKRLLAATTASSCFLFANSLLLFLLARAKTSALTTLAQFAKVCGSLFLLCANLIALGWHVEASLPYVSGVLATNFVTTVWSASAASCATYVTGLFSAAFATAYYL